MKFGLVGHPVGHSLSPAMHNASFKKLGLDYDYVLFDVEKNDLKKFIENAKKREMVGVNVTIPHKVEVIKYVDKLSREAELVGAVNTIKFGKETVGYNTDGIGCVKALEEAGVKVKDRTILLIGAGGAARSIIFQCTLEGATVLISNRKAERRMAVDLSREVKKKLGKTCEVVDLEEDSLSKALKEADIMIHATPVGMHPNTEESIISADIIPTDVTVMDIVYNPMETKLLREAKAKGCKTVSGVGMLVHQGAESERIWLNVNPPVDLMRKVVLTGLKD